MSCEEWGSSSLILYFRDGADDAGGSTDCWVVGWYLVLLYPHWRHHWGLNQVLHEQGSRAGGQFLACHGQRCIARFCLIGKGDMLQASSEMQTAWLPLSSLRCCIGTDHRSIWHALPSSSSCARMSNPPVRTETWREKGGDDSWFDHWRGKSWIFSLWAYGVNRNIYIYGGVLSIGWSS